MSIIDIDFNALFLQILKGAAVLFVLYIFVLIALRLSNYYKITQCPDCGGRLKRSHRSSSDRIIRTFSFGILPIKRYRCYTCYWEGAALVFKQSKQSNTLAETESPETE